MIVEVTSLADDQCKYVSTDIGFVYYFNDEVAEGVMKLTDDIHKIEWMSNVVTESLKRNEDKAMIYNLFVLHVMEQLALYAHAEHINGVYDMAATNTIESFKEVSKFVRL